MNATPNSIPAELLELPQWCLWRTVERDGEKTKLPEQTCGEMAKSNDPATWTSFYDVMSSIDGHDGPGFMLTPPYVGIDLAGCRDSTTGEIQPWVREIIERFNSYSEVSPSGTGVKIFCKGDWPFPTGKKVTVDAN